MDMYDLKPDAPAEFRGEFRPIATNVPGVQICEHFPLQARMWDKLACIRSIVSTDEHSDCLVMTGKSERENVTAHHPSFGSVVSRVRSATADVPPFVSLRGMSRGTEPGFLGISHRPFAPNGPGLENLRPLTAVSTAYLLLRPAEPVGPLNWLGQALQLIGLGLSIAAIASLGRSFAVVAANRGIRTAGVYRFVRHPLMLGFLVAFWAAPVMSPGRLLFAGVITAWVLVAIRIEESTLVAIHGEQYEGYRRRVPALLPRLRSRA